MTISSAGAEIKGYLEELEDELYAASLAAGRKALAERLKRLDVIPMHKLMSQMSSGPAWYENELTNIVREGRSNPSVPIVLIGIEPD